MKSFCLLLVYLLVFDNYENDTDCVKRKHEVFFLENFHFKSLFSRYIKKIKNRICKHCFQSLFSYITIHSGVYWAN